MSSAGQKHSLSTAFCKKRACWTLGAALVFFQVASARATAVDIDPIKEVSGLCKVRAISLAGYGGEENWSSLTVTPDSRVLVGLSSRTHSAILLLVDPRSDRIELVGDLDEAGHLSPSERQPKIHVTPVRDRDGWYHFFSHFGLDTHLPLHGSRIGYEGMRRWRWHQPTGKMEQLGRVLSGEGAVALSASASGRTLFVVTFPQALLLMIDTQTGQVRNLGRTNGVYAPRHILIDQWDNPYILDHRGRFWVFTKSEGMLRSLSATLPVTPDVSGNLLAQGLVALVEADGRDCYLAISAWGQLYEISFTGPGNPTVVDLGRPADRLVNPEWRPVGRRMITAAGLAVGSDGRLYIAVSGYNRAADKSGDSYILRCDRNGTKVKIVARLDGNQISYICGSNAVDRKAGRIFFAGNHLVNDSPYLIVLENLKG